MSPKKLVKNEFKAGQKTSQISTVRSESVPDIDEENSAEDGENFDEENADEDLELDSDSVQSGEESSHAIVPTSAYESDSENNEVIPSPRDHGGFQDGLLKQYLKEVSNYALLTPEEELDLALKLRDEGDLDAAKRLVRANLRLVVKIAMEYRNAYQNIMDLIQEGNIGLMKAVSKFDPSKGARLSYYSGWWIRSYILKYILDNFRLVRVGTTQAQKKLFFQLMREKERLEAQGLNPEPKLLADRLNVREQDVVSMSHRLGSHGAEVSLDRPATPGGSESEDTKTSFLDFVVDGQLLADDTLSEEQLKEMLKEGLQEFEKTLKDKELKVFQERLISEEPKTLQEIANQYGLTRERARQIEAKVIEKLRTHFKTIFR